MSDELRRITETSDQALVRWQRRALAAESGHNSALGTVAELEGEAADRQRSISGLVADGIADRALIDELQTQLDCAHSVNAEFVAKQADQIACAPKPRPMNNGYWASDDDGVELYDTADEAEDHAIKSLSGVLFEDATASIRWGVVMGDVVSGGDMRRRFPLSAKPGPMDEGPGSKFYASQRLCAMWKRRALMAFKPLDEAARLSGWVLIYDPDSAGAGEWAKACWDVGPHGDKDWIYWDGLLCPGKRAEHCPLPTTSVERGS